MTLEFDKVVPQIQQMGHTLAENEESASHIAGDAWESFLTLTDNHAIWQQIWTARQHDAGFRGAAPMDDPNDPEHQNTERLTQAYPLPTCPERATILAADGSQIYPDPHAAILYYLTNIAVFIYRHGVEADLPETVAEPQLYFRDEELHERDGRIIANAAVNARRNVFEMQFLARETHKHIDSEADSAYARPLLSVSDGPLLFWLGGDVPNAKGLMEDYYEALGVLFNARAALAGYVDQPRSRFLIGTLYLMSLDESEITRPNLVSTGPLEGLDDRFLMKRLLGPGERSALLVQQSPQNKTYHDRATEFEIAFFYLNVSGLDQEPYLARVEIPMWVARDPTLVDAVHALLYAQCQLTDRYPYVLTRADECAVVHSYEKQALDEMIYVELLKRQVPFAASQKLSMKNVARVSHTQYRTP